MPCRRRRRPYRAFAGVRRPAPASPRRCGQNQTRWDRWWNEAAWPSVYCAPQFAQAAGAMVSLHRRLRHPGASVALECRDKPGGLRPLMGPGLAAPEREIVGVGGLPARRLFRLDNLIRNALPLAIGHRLFLGVEANGEFFVHVAG